MFSHGFDVNTNSFGLAKQVKHVGFCVLELFQQGVWYFYHCGKDTGNFKMLVLIRELEAELS